MNETGNDTKDRITKDDLISICLSAAYAVVLSWLIDRFLLYHVMIGTEQLFSQLGIEIGDSFFWAYATASGIVCFVIFIVLRLVFEHVLDLQVRGKRFLISFAAGVLIYAVGAIVYDGIKWGFSINGFELYVYIFALIVYMWLIAALLCFAIPPIRKSLIAEPKREVSDAVGCESASEAAGMDARGAYRVGYEQQSFRFLAVLMFAAFTAVNILLVKVNGWTRNILIFAICEYAFVILLILVIKGTAKGIMKGDYLLEADSRGLNINFGKIGFIPWEDIYGFEAYSSGDRDILGIKIIDEEKYTERMTSFKKTMAKQRRFFSESLFEIDFYWADEFLPAALGRIMEYAPEDSDIHIGESPDEAQQAAYESMSAEAQDERALDPESERLRLAGARLSVVALLAINVLVYVVNLIKSINMSSHAIESILDALILGLDHDIGAERFGLATDPIMHGEYYRMFTYAFLHSDIRHLVLNMIALIYIGYRLFAAYGKRTVLAWYIAGIFGGSLFCLAAAVIRGEPMYVIGASGALFGLLGGSMAPMIYRALWIKGQGVSLKPADRRSIFEYSAFVLVMLLPGFFYKDVSWECHLGGLIGGIIAGIAMLALKKRKQFSNG